MEPGEESDVNYCGMDLHSRVTVVHVIDGSGRQICVEEFETSAENLGAFCRSQSKLMKIYLEASTGSAWASRVIEANGHRPVVIDPNRNRLVSGSTKKTDRNDAAALAAAGRAGLLVQVHVRTEATDRIRQLVMARQALVRTRANLVRVVRAIYRADGEVLPKADTDNFAELVKGTWGIDPEQEQSVIPLVESIDAITGQVLATEASINGHAADNAELVRRLKTIPGVGDLIAIAFLSHVEDPRRFENAGQVAGYLGLAPWVNESAGKRRDGTITKHGNKSLRSLLVQGAWAHLRSKGDTALKRWATKLKARVGGKKAVTALARKMAELMWMLWNRGVDYEAMPTSSRRAPAPP